MQLKQTISRHLRNLHGWRTSRQILVIESDDWGGIRMPNKAAYQATLTAGIHVDRCPYNRFDTLENSSDLDALYRVLLSVNDKKGNPAIVTANYNLVNPDFDQIAQTGYTEYHFETFTDTLKRYYPSDDVFAVVMQGMDSKVFRPQYHGREHINSQVWLQLLRSGHKALSTAFQLKFYGLSYASSPSINRPFLAAFQYDNPQEHAIVAASLLDGARIFRELFGYTATTIVPPLYLWDTGLEPVMAEAGVTAIQGANYHRTHVDANRKSTMHREIPGKLSAAGLLYMSRNCTYEPAVDNKGVDASVAACMDDIATAFLWGRPAVISSHRLNYISSLDERNRTRNLAGLQSILSSAKKRWPNIEFLSADALSSLILGSIPA